MINKFLSHPKYSRFMFFLLLFVSICLNSIILRNQTNFYILYIFCAIFLGIGYYNSPKWFIFMLTLAIVVCRYFLIPESAASAATFFTYLLTYLLITFMSVGLMLNVQKVTEENVELTKALSNALDTRDTFTLHHSENVAKYAVDIAERMKLPPYLCKVIHIGGLLHDIGKIGIPEHILSKPGRLEEDEYELIKSHPFIGYEMIKHVKQYESSGILDIVLYHHERYDGLGYPKGLKGEEIPLVARIIAVADTFDAMSSKRVYRDAIELSEILAEIERNKGKQFDPVIADHFLALFDEGGAERGV
ncbi:HD-GYP domain-containing protein [Bacillus sp. B1-b2]|uniref:HD-GYP domain-containing protein n=1 Tax=Bacillus sp. B1-b2 TaxID=2653201 RepID=UPI001261DA60|nr:HD-GYP domain-containing protein [Bacillus sp. B1-b2]KAB7671762.1 HD-GYP domain-containing protein [Bacillus sp. B1-b2]